MGVVVGGPPLLNAANGGVRVGGNIVSGKPDVRIVRPSAASVLVDCGKADYRQATGRLGNGSIRVADDRGSLRVAVLNDCKAASRAVAIGPDLGL